MFFNLLCINLVVFIAFVEVEWNTLINDLFLDLENLTILINFQIGFRCYAVKKSSTIIDKKVELSNTEVMKEPKPSLVCKIGNSRTSLVNHLKSSQLLTSFKLISRTYTNFKASIKSLLWSLVVLLRVDKFVGPMTLNLFYFFKLTFKWLRRAFTLFNFILIVWILILKLLSF